MADQTERAFQKQKNVFLNNKAALIAGPKAKKVGDWMQWVKDDLECNNYKREIYTCTQEDRMQAIV